MQEQKLGKIDFKELLKKQGTITTLGFLLLVVIMTIANKDFLTADNLINITRQITVNGITAVGMTFVILTSGIDLSVGSVMALSGTMMAGFMINFGLSPIVAIFLGICIGALSGLVSGLLVAYVKIPAIIATLAMMEITRGLALIYTGGYPLSGLPSSFGEIGKGYAFGLIPYPVIIMIIVYAIGYIILNHTPAGRYIYALGGNEEAVRLSGIRVKKYKIIPFVISGITASIAGLISTSRLLSGQPNLGVGFELDAIAAVVLGGTAISGGKGHIFGTLIGSLILGVMSNGLNFIGVTPYVQRVFKGLIIILAIYASTKKKD